jgi:eukaryotic-like serine/threonine-protein kinase
VAKCVYRYNEMGTATEGTCLGVDGSPVLSTGGFARVTQSVDGAGRVVERSYFGVDGRLIKTPKGYARQSMKYDSSGNLVEEAYYDADNQLAASAPNGIGRATVKYNGHGQPIEMKRMGKAGTPLVGTTLPYLETVTYSDSGIIAEGTSYFLPPELAASPLGVKADSRVEVRYDALGNTLESNTYHPILKPTTVSNATVERQTKDGSDYRTLTTYLDKAGKLAIGPDGYAREVMRNDANGRPLVVECFGTDGNLINSCFGIARVEMKYDSRGSMVDAILFGADGTPMQSLGSPYRTSKIYRNGETPVEISYSFRLPTTATRTQDGSPPVRVIEKYNDRGQKTERLIHRELSGSLAEGNLVVAVQRRDAKDRDIETSYLGNDGHLCLHDADGLAISRRTWNDKGQLLEESYFDVAGRPTRNRKLGFAKITSTYDGIKRSVEHRYFDETDAPTASVMGIYRRIAITDIRGRTIEERFFNANGKPMKTNQGIAGIKRKYGAGTQPTEVVSINENGNPCRAILGYAKMRVVHDVRGNVISEEFLDENDQPAPVIASGGYNRVLTTFDRNNRPVLREFVFGIPALPNGPKGVPRGRERLDARGNPIESQNLDSSGQLVLNVDGYAILKYEYDSLGRAVSESYFDTRSQATNLKQGYHRFTQRYEGPARAEAAYFDKENRPVVGHTGWARLIRTPGTAGSPPTWRALDAHGGPAAVEMLINQVVPGGQGAKLGALSGDVIVSYNSIDIIDHAQMGELVDSGPDSERKLVLDRAGKKIEGTVRRGKIGLSMQVHPKQRK